MVIVTGGAGFIGSNIIKALNNSGYNNILVVDNLQDGAKYNNLVGLNIVDYMDKEHFFYNIVSSNNLGPIDVVFHEGACSSTTEWNGKYLMYNNYQYSKELLKYCIKFSIPFLYASSAAIYGVSTENLNKSSEYEKPLNIYSYSKFLFDQYVRKLLPYTKSQICGLRYFNVYGPRESHKGNMASMIFRLHNQINEGNTLQLFTGSKEFKRDFIYIKDVADINLWCWINNISGIFDCGTGQSISFQFIAEAVINYYKKGNLEFIPFPETLKNHYQIYTKANLTHLRSVGYRKTFKSISEGIVEYLNWLNCND